MVRKDVGCFEICCFVVVVVNVVITGMIMRYTLS